MFDSSFTRRSFLKKTLLGSTALTLANLLPTGCEKYPEPDTELSVLSAKEYAIIKAIADRMIPKENVHDIGAEDLEVAKYIDRFFLGVDSDLQIQLRLLLQIFEYGAYFHNLKFKKFTNLSKADQDSFIHSWATSKIAFKRQGFQGLKRICIQGFYKNEKSWKMISYDGPWV